MKDITIMNWVANLLMMTLPISCTIIINMYKNLKKKNEIIELMKKYIEFKNKEIEKLKEKLSKL
jgi:hypothetical protein